MIAPRPTTWNCEHMTIDPILQDAITAKQEGRYDDALRHLITVFDQNCGDNSLAQARHFITMFEWSMLAECYPPAHQALATARDEQVRLLLNGDAMFNSSGEYRERSRFEVIAEMNDILKDARSTYDVFLEIESLLPELARRHISRALPAIVEAGDFARAERYLPDPLKELDYLNGLTNTFPLFPPNRTAPRLAAELSNFMKDVRLRESILRGLGREDEAQALRGAALAGIVSDEMRALAEREIESPGAITPEVVSRSMALDGREAPTQRMP